MVDMGRFKKGGGERTNKEDMRGWERGRVGEWERGRRKENMGESESVW